ncbi:hypothetical protein BO71DRAFT_475959 [Aspergillus ellipticus CBS 707.79]|uniref:Uncharacterized protein n=1 Tax=Aspergillus ellipticus CBS 707.79 TaxID=1448320 RepID=A0A319DAN2_9EURO|nr:hypothetical protein BO71DRAFT_475959 [Aspergillus ellipticus CBS 707.79]
MTETLLSYLVKRNPRVIAPGQGGSTFTFSTDWDTIEDVEEWTEFNYDTLTRRFGEDLRRQKEATTLCMTSVVYAILYAITGPVSAVLGPSFITSGGRVLENLGCYPDWGVGREGITNANGRSKALALGDTKFKWSTTNAINTINIVRTGMDDSYEDAPMRDDVRPFEQVQYYGAVYKCRHVFVITEKELVVMQLHLAPVPVRTSPRPVRTRQPPPSHQRVVSSSTVSRQLTDMSIDESVLKARIGLVKYKRIPWSVENGLTIKLALYCLIRLAVEDGSDLKTEYPSLIYPVGPSPGISEISEPLSTSQSPKPSQFGEGKGKIPNTAASMTTASSVTGNSSMTNKMESQYRDVKVAWNKSHTGYNYALGDPTDAKSWIIDESPESWREIGAHIFKFSGKPPFLRSLKPTLG